MKKEVKIIISAILAVWCFFMGFELGSYKEKKAAASTVVTAAPTQAPETTTAPAQTAAPITQAPETTFPVADPTVNTGVVTEPIATTAPAATDAPTVDPVPTTLPAAPTAPAAPEASSMSKEEILKAVTAAINGAKNETNMTAVKTEKVTIVLTDLSVSSLKSLVNGIIQDLAGEEVITYTFANGQGTGVDQTGKASDDGATVTPMQVIPPTGREFALTIDGVKDATVTKNADGSTTYVIKLVEENTVITSPVPTHHHAAYGFLDLASINISGVEFTEANMHYPTTEITVTVNPDGKATEIHTVMPMTGEGAAKVAFASGNAKFEGSDDELWKFTY